MLLKILFLFAALSLLYLLAMWLSARFCTTRRKGLGTGFSSGYMIIVMLACFSLASRSDGVVYTPLFQVVAFLLFHAGMVVSLAGSWFIHSQEAECPASLTGFVRGGYWFSLLTTPLLWLIIFLQVPVISPITHTMYWGPVTLALILYFVLNRLLINRGRKWLGMAVAVHNLSDSLGERFHDLQKFVAAIGDYPLILLSPGFRNAAALYPQKRILLGMDLLVHLGDKEVQAILLHEIGHLKDKKYIVLRQRLSQLLPFALVAWLVFDQSGVFGNPLVRVSVLVLGVFGISMVFRRLRLKGEFVADSFVKNYPGDFHSHLLTGIEQMTRLNGMDKDFCKKHNYGHLDLDERRDMVEKGKFAIKRKPVRRFILATLGFMLLGALFQFGWSTLFPSATNRWSTLHKRYHQQYNKHNYEQAGQTIHQSLELSLLKFGEINRHTYISLKDLAQCTFRQNNVAEAEQYILRAGRIGRKLYGAGSLHRSTEWRLLAAIRLHQHQKNDARQIYTSLESLQQQAKDRAYNRSRTLYSLAALAGSTDKKIGYYKKIVRLYRDSPPDATPSEDIFPLLARMYTEMALPDKAEAILTEAVTLIGKKKGATGNEYGNALYELATLLRDLKKYHKAKQFYQECIDIGSGVEAYIPIGCRYGLAESFRLQNMLDKAEQELRQALHLEENLYDRNSSELVYGLKELAAVVKEQGNQELADQYLQRALKLETTE